MNSKIYRQYDSRWGSKPYPTSRSSFAGNGCGCVSVTHLLMETDKYKNITPETIRPYMCRYAVSGKGTLWNGIPDSLKHYGFGSYVHLGQSDPMSKAWAELNKGDRIGIILFSAGYGGSGSKKVYWTGGGHYIAFTDYKVKNGRHYMYMKDSGPRCHDGWYSYEESMRGRVSQMWIFKKPDLKVGSLPVGTIKKGDKGADVKAWQKFLKSHGYPLQTTGGTFGKLTVKNTKAFQKKYELTVDGVVGSKTIAKAKTLI